MYGFHCEKNKIDSKIVEHKWVTKNNGQVTVLTCDMRSTYTVIECWSRLCSEKKKTSKRKEGCSFNFLCYKRGLHCVLLTHFRLEPSVMTQRVYNSCELQDDILRGTTRFCTLFEGLVSPFGLNEYLGLIFKFEKLQHP